MRFPKLEDLHRVCAENGWMLTDVRKRPDGEAIYHFAIRVPMDVVDSDVFVFFDGAEWRENSRALIRDIVPVLKALQPLGVE